MKENNILRLALITEDQSATTVDKYVCKLVESVLFSYDDQKLSAVDLCKLIKDQFELEFDVMELETAIRKKSKGRILCFGHEYQLAPKVINQLSKQKDPLSLLKLSISKFLNETKSSYDSEKLLDNIQKYLYHCFNSSIDNLLNLLQTKNTETITKFDAPAEVVQQINEFIAWDDTEKNKLIYDIISFSYEYCMLTTKKDTLLSKNIFKGKRFFLDTNIIFRMAGINKDERQFVIESFVKKSKEIGVELYYTSETLSELYRVIDGQIRYIQYLTQGQAPLDATTLQSIDYSNELNDFYVLYYNWCNEPQNNYDDFSSFQKYLVSLIREVLENLNFSDVPNEASGRNKDIFEEQCSLLFDYKKEKRPQKRNSMESTRTDINNIFYILSLRNAASTPSLWQINDYLVSADQLLTNWSRNQYSGVPIVVIPSTWLSIMLRFSGRSEDDYKAFCLFMSLRQHKEAEDEITINPVSLLNSLAKRTSDKSIKYQIIEEIITNKNEYQFSTKEDYSVSIENAFEKILTKSTEEVRETMLSVMSDKEKEHAETINELSSKLKERSTKDEYVFKIASNKAQKKVDWWKKFKFLQTFIPFVTTILMVGAGVVSIFKLEPIYSFLTGILPGKNPTGIVTLPLLSFVSGVLMNVIVIYPLNYLTSDDRKQILIKRYEKRERKYLDD